MGRGPIEPTQATPAWTVRTKNFFYGAVILLSLLFRRRNPKVRKWFDSQLYIIVLKQDSLSWKENLQNKFKIPFCCIDIMLEI
jgi:hypothetical protein